MNQKLGSKTVSLGLGNLKGPTTLTENKTTPLRTTGGPIPDQWSLWFGANTRTSKIGAGVEGPCPLSTSN